MAMNETETLSAHEPGESKTATDLPNAEDTDENMVGETSVKHLAQDEDITVKGTSKHDRHVTSVK